MTERFDTIEAVLYKAESEAAFTDALNDDLGKPGKVHDWRNYVPHDLRPFWSHLSREARLCLWMVCERQAANEEWD